MNFRQMLLILRLRWWLVLLVFTLVVAGTAVASMLMAKKYQAKTGVGRPALQAFAGSLEGQRASKGVFLTTSYFTSEAEEYVRRITRRIVLVDGRTLTRLMYDHGIGVRAGRSLVVKRVDEGYFEGEI